MVFKLFSIVVFMAAAVAALLWVPLEWADAVSEGSDWIWYLALGMSAVAVVFVVIAAARSRTRGMIALTVTATVMLAGVLLTYPTDKAACKPAAEQSASSGGSTAGIGKGIQVDDGDFQTDEPDAPAADCK